MNLNNIMKRQERKEGEYINVFNEEYKYNKLVKNVCFNSDMEIIDIEYNLLGSALCFIDEVMSIDNVNSIDDVDVCSFIDTYMPVYTCDFLNWFKEVGTEYTDRAIEEYGEFNTTTDLLIKGYSIHMERVFFIAIDVVKAIIEEHTKQGAK